MVHYSYLADFRAKGLSIQKKIFAVAETALFKNERSKNYYPKQTLSRHTRK